MTLAWNLLVTLAWSSLSVTGGRYEYPGGVGLYLLCYLSDGFGLWKDSEHRTKVTLRREYSFRTVWGQIQLLESGMDASSVAGSNPARLAQSGPRGESKRVLARTARFDWKKGRMEGAGDMPVPRRAWLVEKDAYWQGIRGSKGKQSRVGRTDTAGRDSRQLK